jgi:hypothetical protein
VKTKLEIKRLILFFGIVLLVTIAGFSFVACDDNSGSNNPFVGTWSGRVAGGHFVTITFTDFTWVLTIQGEHGAVDGTYDFEGNSAILTGSVFTPYNGTAIIIGTTLSLNIGGLTGNLNRN